MQKYGLTKALDYLDQRLVKPIDLRQLYNIAGSRAEVWSHDERGRPFFLPENLDGLIERQNRGERELFLPDGHYLDSAAAARIWCVSQHWARTLMRQLDGQGSRKMGRAWFILEDVAKEIAKVRQLPSNGEAARPR